MLDVAACAEALLATGPARLLRVAQAAQVETEALRRTFMTLVALHDVGKFSTTFARRINNGFPGMHAPPSRHPDRSHWQISFDLLQGPLTPLLGRVLPNPDSRKSLFAAVAGHHGVPPDMQEPPDTLGAAAAEEFTHALLDLFDPPELRIRSDVAATLSWTLAGLTTIADWLGSNQDWFPYREPSIDIKEYWRIARAQAQTALQEAGALGAPLAEKTGLKALFGLSQARPMQAAAETLQLPDGPVLAVIEDATGSGKTEAALLLAHRMMRAGKAQGIYFALPTMATANAMYARLSTSYRRLFGAGAPSLALAHGRRTLHEGFRKAVEAPAGRGEDGENAAAACAAWIADDRRKAFLAEIGVGTIDQALLAALPVKHGALRLWGLSDRVLIIDEAHAYDAYMTEELAAVLEFHAALGGSAILMTATLPEEMRRKLCTRFKKGLGAGKSRAQAPCPSISIIARDAETVTPVEPAAGGRRNVPVRRITSAGEAQELIEAAARGGAAVAWVRNAVDDAIAAADALAARGLDVTCFHARYAMSDRLSIEEDVVRRFGRDSTPAERAGRVVVATQVIEQSLDCDFDLMVTDLAPIDLMIQRAGRLWRHERERPAGASPVLHVLSPDPGEVHDERWLQTTLDRGAFVYPHDLMWKSARALFEAGGIASPDGLRDLVEAVYGEGGPEVPQALQNAEIRRDGEGKAQTAQAQRNLLDVAKGYYQSGRGADDALYPTRLGEPQIGIALARMESGALVPWAGAETPALSWALSELGISAKRFGDLVALVDQADPRILAAKAGWPDWKKKQISVLPVDAEGEIAGGLRYDVTRGFLDK